MPGKGGGFMVTWSYTQQKMSTEQVGANEGANDLSIIMDHPGDKCKTIQ